MIYTHVLNKGGRGVKSPLDRETWVAPPPHKAEQQAAVYRVAPAAA